MFVMYHKEERKKETSGKRDMYDIRAKRGYREREREVSHSSLMVLTCHDFESCTFTNDV